MFWLGIVTAVVLNRGIAVAKSPMGQQRAVVPEPREETGSGDVPYSDSLGARGQSVGKRGSAAAYIGILSSCVCVGSIVCHHIVERQRYFRSLALLPQRHFQNVSYSARA